MDPISGNSTEPNIPGVLGVSSTFNGVLGYTTADEHAGVAGACDEGNGNGVYGRSKNRNGVIGYTTGDGHAGVAGACDEGNGLGVYGRSKNRSGIHGTSSAAEHSGVVGDNDRGTGVLGRSSNGRGVWGLSENAVGVLAQTKSTNSPALAAYQSNPASNMAALIAKHDGHKTAGRFEGNVEITGTLNVAGQNIVGSASPSDVKGIVKAAVTAILPALLTAVGVDGLAQTIAVNSAKAALDLALSQV